MAQTRAKTIQDLRPVRRADGSIFIISLDHLRMFTQLEDFKDCGVWTLKADGDSPWFCVPWVSIADSLGYILTRDKPEEGVKEVRF